MFANTRKSRVGKEHRPNVNQHIREQGTVVEVVLWIDATGDLCCLGLRKLSSMHSYSEMRGGDSNIEEMVKGTAVSPADPVPRWVYPKKDREE